MKLKLDNNKIRELEEELIIETMEDNKGYNCVQYVGARAERYHEASDDFLRQARLKKNGYQNSYMEKAIAFRNVANLLDNSVFYLARHQQKKDIRKQLSQLQEGNVVYSSIQF